MSNMAQNTSQQLASGETREYVTAQIAGQHFGVPVLAVQDVLGPQRLASIPLAPPEVAGALNLRGRIVTAFDVRRRLGLPPADRAKSMSVVVEHHGEPYSLLIDEVGEVLSVPADRIERNPPTLDAHWREVAVGIYRLDGRLLVMLDVDKLLDFAVA
ncbi:MAG: chemotaxis protein CheW [Alphaproteobacteria bacterium]|nr:chemotaxis protein CheW [Alphaproteobacteria bacterium]